MTASALFDPAVARPVHRTRTRTVPAAVGGVALAASPLLLAAGLWTDPPQPTDDTVGYLQSLVQQPELGLVSANLLHYGWVAFGLGVLALLALAARGERGRVPTVLAAIAGGLGAVQMSGLLVSDWFGTSIALNIGPEAGAATFDASMTADVQLWKWTSILLLLVSIVATIVAAVRTRALPLPVALLILAVPAGMMMPTILLQGAVMAVAAVPFAWIGVRLVAGREA